MKPMLIGTILPDLIDKPLYYILGPEYYWISGTRTIGHSGLFFLALLAIAIFSGSRAWLALCLGVLTHLVLDVVGDSLELFDAAASTRAILYPLLGPFHMDHGSSLLQHVNHRLQSTYIISCEIIGALCLAWIFFQYWKSRKLT